VALALLAEDPRVRGSAPAAVDALIRGRAAVLDEMASRNEAVLREASLQPLVSRLVRARERLANLSVRGPADEPPERYRVLLEQAALEREQIERELAQRSLPFREARARATAGLAEITAALDERDALLGYAVYGEPAAYLAYALRRGWAPVIRKVGSASEVSTLVREWRQAVLFEAQAAGRSPSLSLAGQERAGAALRRRIWDPLAAILRGARRVHVVPDGVLHLINLAALPAGGGRYLVETAPVLHVLSSERDLLEPGGTLGAGLLAVGAPAYDDSSGLDGGETRVAYRGAPVSCAALEFGALEQTRSEAEEVASLWRSSGTGEDTLLLRDAAASEGAFKRAAPGRRILHLATHGFFTGHECLGEGTAEGSGNPLLRAGLAFAGANRREEARESGDDGILTAEEVAALDLGGVEWAVLSACDTGVGDIQTGEGVLGLQRAFRIAGARNVILSLWPVEDRAGREWMAALYRHRLRDRLSTSEAVRRATLDVLESRRSRGSSTHPFYWAAFLATGPEVR
jgi:CHAT domain-containing protein